MQFLPAYLLLTSVSLLLVSVSADAAEPKEVQQVINMIGDYTIPAIEREVTDEYETVTFPFKAGEIVIMYTKIGEAPELGLVYYPNVFPRECIVSFPGADGSVVSDFYCFEVILDAGADGEITEAFETGFDQKSVTDKKVRHFLAPGAISKYDDGTDRPDPKNYNDWQETYDTYIKKLIAYELEK